MNGINKQFKTTLLILVTFFSLVLLWNIAMHLVTKRVIAKNQLLPVVSTAKTKSETWQPTLYAVGTLTAIYGTALSSQASGNIVKINFESGQRVKKNDLLIQIDDRAEQAELQNNLAALKLAEVTYLRNKELVEKGAISKQNFDEATAKYQQAQALAAQTQAIIDYKHITAPFDGKIGIRQVSLGQYVKAGDSLVSLEALNPLYVNFYLPENNLHKVYVGQSVNVTVDPSPNKFFSGKLTAIDSLVDVQTHNISLQATIPNANEILYPGLFARVRVLLPQKKNVVSIPQTAINYTLYGNTVYVVNNKGKDDDDKPIYIITLREIDTGEQRDGKVIVTKGLKAGEVIVSSGQLKLSNGARVNINNSVTP